MRETGDALDELSSSFNAMLDRIGGLMTAMRDSLDNVAHDLRTPMARWRGTAERALASGNIDAQREALADCLEESDRILAMLNTLMDISEAETGTMKLSRDPVALLPLLREVLDLYAEVAEDRQVPVSLQADSVDVTVPGDSGPAAAGVREPARQRDQVHTGRRTRDARRGASPAVRSCRDGDRLGNWHHG